MNLKIIISLLPLLCMLWGSSCSDSKDELLSQDNYMEAESKILNFERTSYSKVLDINTNIDPTKIHIEILGNGANWCETLFIGKKLTIKVQSNTSIDKRETAIELRYGKLKEKITITQNGLNLDGLKDDIKQKIISGEASSFQSGYEIDASFDGDYETIYHSNWGEGNTNFPVTLKYNLLERSEVDYVVYTPRRSGPNGRFGKFELYITTTDAGRLKLGEYNFLEMGSATRLDLPKYYENVESIEFIVKTATGDFVSCAEMEFFAKNSDNFNYLTIFKDLACSQLKDGITQKEVEAVSDDFYRALATDIFNEKYDPEFRVQSYKSFIHPDIQAEAHKTTPYSLRDNPTGIYVKEGDDLIVFADRLKGNMLSLYIQDLTKGFDGGISLPLVEGLNKYKIEKGGLVYVMYHTQTGNEPPVIIHFATGEINGYFDNSKHKTEDWERLLSKAKFHEFDVIGKYAHLTLPTEDFRKYTPDGLALINRYDELSYLEQEFMGLEKYKKMFKNRMYFLVDYGDGYMYATAYRTAYTKGTMEVVASLNELNTSPWGPAHEVGHVNQTSPGLKWIGLTEVTNNIHSLYVETSFGCTSRLIREDRYKNAIKEIVKPKIAHLESQDVFNRLVPFWQLKLYLVDVLGKKDVYKDLYEYYRVNPNLDTSVSTEGVYQLLFVENVCRLANLDLTEFFEQWGFLTPIDIVVEDYAVAQFTITQPQILDLKQRIASKNYPKPKHHNIYEITDNNVTHFR